VIGRWQARDPLPNANINLIANIYIYCQNKPLICVDPFGLWQLTIGGGDGFGGIITVGNNGGSNAFNGQWNFGGFIGGGVGLYGNLNLNNSGCHKSGLEGGARATGGIGLGNYIEGDASLGSNGIEGSINGNIPPVSGGFGVNNGHFTTQGPILVFGEGGAVGIGVIAYQ
jgi:hypothetical protein